METPAITAERRLLGPRPTREDVWEFAECVSRATFIDNLLLCQPFCLFTIDLYFGALNKSFPSRLADLDKLSLQRLILSEMKKTIEVGKGRRRIGSPEEAAFLELAQTTDMLSRGLVRILKTENLSPTQYNVLRILRGAPEGLPCGEIASRMITRDPDVTRLLDRLETRKLISRCRDAKDRRTVRARITPEGLKVLARLEEPVQGTHRRQLGHLGRERLRSLSDLLRVSRRQVA